MSKEIYRYTFSATVPLLEVENSLLLAVLSTASLHGEAQVRLDAAHFLDVDRRVCVVDASTSVGRDLNRLFVGFVHREFGEDAFQVERVDTMPTRSGQEVAA
jgi:hypothetical protein